MYTVRDRFAVTALAAALLVACSSSGPNQSGLTHVTVVDAQASESAAEDAAEAGPSEDDSGSTEDDSGSTEDDSASSEDDSGSETGPVTGTLGPGEPCTTNTQCASALCQYNTWCGGSCTSDAECGTSAYTGQPMRCIATSPTSGLCFPGCSSNTNCDYTSTGPVPVSCGPDADITGDENYVNVCSFFASQ